MGEVQELKEKSKLLSFAGGGFTADACRDMLDTIEALQQENEQLRESAILAHKEEVQELAKAKAEGRLMILPNIKLYKTLYWIWGDEIMPVKYMGIHHGTVDKAGKYHVVCRMLTKKDRTFHHRGKPFTYKAGNERWFYVDDIGKTVFLSREEVDKAIGGGQDERST